MAWTVTSQGSKKEENMETKFCKHCGAQIDADCMICPKCGKQVEELKAANPENIVINNNNTAKVTATVVSGKAKRKWVAFFLCLFLGWLGIHRFYEGKIGTGILWLLTLGLFGIGWIIDLILILLKPDPYYV